MAAVKLGWEGISVIIILARGQDWITTLLPPTDLPTPIWPDGTTVVAQIFPPGTAELPPDDWPAPDFEWPAVITDADEIYFKVESAIVDTVVDESVVRVYAKFPNTPTTDDYRWLKGTVKRSD
jgi:hypothetical protein